jgi:hypothetical protein
MEAFLSEVKGKVRAGSEGDRSGEPKFHELEPRRGMAQAGRATAKGGLSGPGKPGFRIYIVASRRRGGPLPPALRISHAGCQAPLAERLGEGGQNQFFG